MDHKEWIMRVLQQGDVVLQMEGGESNGRRRSPESGAANPSPQPGQIFASKPPKAVEDVVTEQICFSPKCVRRYGWIPDMESLVCLTGRRSLCLLGFNDGPWRGPASGSEGWRFPLKGTATRYIDDAIVATFPALGYDLESFPVLGAENLQQLSLLAVSLLWHT